MTGNENINWALDTDFRLARRALGNFAIISSNGAWSDYIHSISPNTTYKRFEHHGNRFISVFQGEPKRLFGSDNDFYLFCQDKLCVAQSMQAYAELKNYNLKNIKYIPYIADLDNYYPIPSKECLRSKYKISRDDFIICNFMRDSIGSSLLEPKSEKGPDIFAKIVDGVCNEIGYDKVLVLLGGPRRHWIRNELSRRSIRYVYIGSIVDEDDMNINILSATVVNELMNMSDLLIISSRSEGGPRSILEAGASMTPIISTDVGIASDVLDGHVIYKDIEEAVALAVKHFQNKFLNEYIEYHYKNVCQNHSVNYISSLWHKLYSEYSRTAMLSPKKRFYFNINDYNTLYNIKKRFIN